MTHTNREHVIKNETLQAENAKVKTMTRPGKPTAWVLVAHVRERCRPCCPDRLKEQTASFMGTECV
jgi:hypothetical protein